MTRSSRAYPRHWPHTISFTDHATTAHAIARPASHATTARAIARPASDPPANSTETRKHLDPAGACAARALSARALPAPRPVISWAGGKRRLLKHLLPLIPPHTTYCEVFGGGLALFCAKPPSPAEIINDINGDLVAFYRNCKKHCGALLKEMLACPPASRAPGQSRPSASLQAAPPARHLRAAALRRPSPQQPTRVRGLLRTTRPD